MTRTRTLGNQAAFLAPSPSRWPIGLGLILLPLMARAGAAPAPEEGDPCDICTGQAGYSASPAYPDIVFVLDTVQDAVGLCVLDGEDCCAPSFTGCGMKFNGHWERGQAPFTSSSHSFTVATASFCGGSNTNTYTDIAGSVSAWSICNTCEEGCY